jgi:hypothetical protein
MPELLIAAGGIAFAVLIGALISRIAGFAGRASLTFSPGG